MFRSSFVSKEDETIKINSSKDGYCSISIFGGDICKYSHSLVEKNIAQNIYLKKDLSNMRGLRGLFIENISCEKYLSVNIYSRVNISQITSPKMEMNNIHLWRKRSLSFRLLLKQKKIKTITRSFQDIKDILYLFVMVFFNCFRNLPNNYNFCTIFVSFSFCFRIYITTVVVSVYLSNTVTVSKKVK